MSTASAPRARALNTSMPVRMPPSTKIFSLPPTAAAMSGRTSAVAGHWSSTRPPWLETTMPAAPASRAFSAPRTVMMPLRMKGFSAHWTICLQLLHGLAAGGGIAVLQEGQARGVDVHGDGEGLRRPGRQVHLLPDECPCSRASPWGRRSRPAPRWRGAAAAMTAGSVPSPVKAAMPASRAGGDQDVVVAGIVVLVAVVELHGADGGGEDRQVTGPAEDGRSWVSGGLFSQMVSMLTQISCHFW